MLALGMLRLVATGALVWAAAGGLGTAARAETPGRELAKYRGSLWNGTKFEGKHGRLSGELFAGTDAHGQPVEMSRADVATLYESKGTYAGIGAAAGAVSGALSAGLGILNASLDDDVEIDTGAAFVVTVALTCVSGVVGGVVGHRFERWAPVQIREPSALRAPLPGPAGTFLSWRF